ncbi:lipid II:glycine glycyltransferase (peptidoglycan interpeptide bridge formation enzyme) [Weissella beninensis]|uniref:Peptidoglycan bridge formation glycyltransferase FemA/FemB family protein n=1 Tax=Periweissella beninensis TaxID=504936 RepID=A0ABT0VFJ3_9LACO|nr:peptidoglycan bridge formation glycyltransferase FemA/FemB family protein [Periweissella beninensis]MBM7543637.1 lipid II:glycine glycyltransferase (peptidoglycan interpeptide bridge formation enzyme) [Periweissella beninensis]MCM2436617.1 peptidoglycan bridge formation glycyltransferase FemA/FemB family protein [Periweissella beninensis]
MPVLDINNQEEVQKFTTFVRSSKYGQITQDLGWADVKDNWEPLHVYLEDGGAIIAAMSILMTKLPNGSRFAYASKGPVMDVHNLDLVDKLVAEAKATLLAKNVYLLRMDPEVDYSKEFDAEIKKHGYETRNVNALGLHGTIQPRFNMVVDLTGKTTQDEIVAGFTAKTRNKVRKGWKNEVTTRYSNDETDLAIFYKIYQEMADRHGITYRPYDYFQRMLKAFGNDDIMRIYICEKDNQVLATGLGFAFGDKVWYMYAGSVSGEVFEAPRVMQVAMMEWAVAAGKHAYDLGGVGEIDPDDNLYRFKVGFLGKDEPREYIGEIEYVLDDAVYEELVRQKDRATASQD